MPKQEPEIKRGRGRPRGQTAKVAKRNMTLREMAQEYVPEAIRVVAEIAMDVDGTRSDRDRLTAINILLDRGYGKAAQADATQADTGDVPLATIRREIVDPVKKKVSETEKTG